MQASVMVKLSDAETAHIIPSCEIENFDPAMQFHFVFRK